MSCGCYRYLPLPNAAKGLSAVCECGISWGRAIHNVDVCHEYIFLIQNQCKKKLKNSSQLQSLIKFRYLRVCALSVTILVH